MMVGFRTPEFRGKRAESVGTDRIFCFVLRQAGGTDEGCPAVVLGGLRDRFVLGR